MPKVYGDGPMRSGPLNPPPPEPRKPFVPKWVINGFLTAGTIFSFVTMGAITLSECSADDAFVQQHCEAVCAETTHNGVWEYHDHHDNIIIGTACVCRQHRSEHIVDYQWYVCDTDRESNTFVCQ